MGMMMHGPHDGESWPYHDDGNGTPTPCAENPCREHVDGNGLPTDSVAMSLEEAYGMRGHAAARPIALSSSDWRVMAPTRAKAPRPVDVFDNRIASDGRVLSIGHHVIDRAHAQLRAVESDSLIDPVVAADYAGYLAGSVIGMAVCSWMTGDGTPGVGTRIGFGDADGLIARAPSLFVLDAHARDEANGRHRLAVADGGPEYDSIRLLRHFGRGQVKSAAALRVILGFTPGAGDGTRWLDAVGTGPDDRTAMTPMTAMMEAARHPWGGVVLAGAALSYDDDAPMDRREYAERVLCLSVDCALRHLPMIDVPTAVDYDSLYPGGGIPDTNGDIDDFAFNSILAYSWLVPHISAALPVGELRRLRDVDISAAGAADASYLFAGAPFTSDSVHLPLRQYLAMRTTAAARLLHMSRSRVCSALSAAMADDAGPRSRDLEIGSRVYHAFSPDARVRRDPLPLFLTTSDPVVLASSARELIGMAAKSDVRAAAPQSGRRDIMMATR